MIDNHFQNGISDGERRLGLCSFLLRDISWRSLFFGGQKRFEEGLSVRRVVSNRSAFLDKNESLAIDGTHK